METNEWALILFSILIQTAVGAFAFLTCFRQFMREEGTQNVYRKAMLVLVPIVVVAVAASLLHLGKPMAAMRALLRLNSSWLSREVFFAGGFAVLVVGTVLTEKTPAIRKVVEWLGVLAGACALVSMAMLYHMTMKPAWQGFNTFLVVFGGAVLLGAGLCSGLLVLFGQESALRRHLEILVWASVAALVVQLVGLPFYLTSLQTGGKAAQETLGLLSGSYAPALVTRWALTLVGGLVPMLLVLRRVWAGRKSMALVYTALAFVLTGEVVGRYLFYATGVTITIG
ncbi:MAG TPA: DmsC/YnfH family molybdoenzyme membrane anchor subunit [Symbiobacteriaceae bacterium]|nr:DmsC/YnfH family molybdoenzyme membrane anchor subunit [Symbiobacteriaceae bacterium]